MTTRATAQVIKQSSSEEEVEIETLKSSTTFLTHAEPVIDPNDSMEYDSELKMLEEFYQTKCQELPVPCPLHGQSFIGEKHWDVKEEEEEEEYNVEEEEKDGEELNNTQVLYSPETVGIPPNESFGPENSERDKSCS